MIGRCMILGTGSRKYLCNATVGMLELYNYSEPDCTGRADIVELPPLSRCTASMITQASSCGTNKALLGKTGTRGLHAYLISGLGLLWLHWLHRGMCVK